MQSNKEMIVYLRERQEDVPSRVFDAMEVVDRREFLPEGVKQYAYEPCDPLPIGHGQTCSAPEVVSFMCKHLELEKGQKVLEVGGGCGYHASVVAEIIDPGKVVSLEIVPELANMERENISRAKKLFGRDWNIEVVNADGSGGYAKEKPYDRMYFAAGIPESYPMNTLCDQLTESGKCLLAPRLGFFKLGTKSKGKIISEHIFDGPFGFVPLTGRYGSDR